MQYECVRKREQKRKSDARVRVRQERTCVAARLHTGQQEVYKVAESRGHLLWLDQMHSHASAAERKKSRPSGPVDTQSAT